MIGHEASSFDRSARLSLSWLGLAALALILVPVCLRTTVPVFHLLWLVVPLLDLLWFRRTDRLGIERPDIPNVVRYAGFALAGYGVLLLVFEPITGVYARLLDLALMGPDPTFAWLVRYPSPWSWVGLAVFSGGVSLFSEELFFRGWLQARLRDRWTATHAVVGQALVFTGFQSLPVLFFSPSQAIAYLVVYAFGLGVLLGWAAEQTHSIWASLLTATTANLLLTVLLLP